MDARLEPIITYAGRQLALRPTGSASQNKMFRATVSNELREGLEQRRKIFPGIERAEIQHVGRGNGEPVQHLRPFGGTAWVKSIVNSARDDANSLLAHAIHEPQDVSLHGGRGNGDQIRAPDAR